MDKVFFKLLFWRHKVLQFLKIKSKRNCIIKIWWDEKTQDTLLYANVRCGVWHMPVGRKCDADNKVYSYWLASIVKTSQYGLNNNKTIFTLVDVKDKEILNHE